MNSKVIISLARASRSLGLQFAIAAFAIVVVISSNSAYADSVCAYPREAIYGGAIVKDTGQGIVRVEVMAVRRSAISSVQRYYDYQGHIVREKYADVYLMWPFWEPTDAAQIWSDLLDIWSAPQSQVVGRRYDVLNTIYAGMLSYYSFVPSGSTVCD